MILPDAERRSHTELWRALEEAFAVVFVGGADLERADAAVVFPGAREPERPDLPRLVLHSPRPPRPSPFVVQMARSDGLDRALHGQRLLEESGGAPAAVPVGKGWRVLAAGDGRPIWAQLRHAGVDREVASAVPSELGRHEFLRDHLTAGRFWSLLPLVHFLKRISGDVPARPRPLDASFIIDDPNPRLGSYGHVRFGELARDARECGYHVAIATIPLDLVLPGRRAVALLRHHPAQLSLVVHGNDHVRRELERPRSAREAERLVRSAVTRVAMFERRAGIRVERVMCPPHGACGPHTLAALFRSGFLALAASRPFPWDAFSDQPHWRLGGWLPAQLAGGGLPIVSRYLLTRNLDDLVFRAFLDQPLVLYCHHADLRDGLDRLRAAAARAAQLGDVSWRSLAAIARRRAVVQDGEGAASLTVYSRDLSIPRPRASVLQIDVPRIFGGGDSLRIILDGRCHDVRPDGDGRFRLTVADKVVTRDLRLRIDAGGDVGAAAVLDWRPRAWPLARRVLTESRDRLQPLVLDRHR